MDLIKTLLVYMILVVGSATEVSPLLTPPPADAPTATPYVTQAPTAIPTAVPTPEPTATPTPYTTLYVGDRGEDVRKLQRRLAELGYLTDKIDGIYGQNTRRAVERFQYYNSLTVDGVAGRATQAALFENPRVVTAPPDITPGPTFTPAPPRGVTVPVYYVDENNRLLNRVDMVCYGDTTIFANSNNVGTNYSLISSSPVRVTVTNGVASPATVIFRYQLNVSPAPTAETVSVPVYYMTDTGALLHQTSVSLTRGATTYVSANAALVPDFYQLTSQSPVAVTVTAQGAPRPATVVFTYRNVTPTEAPAPRKVTIPIRYVNESGFLLNESSVTVEYGTQSAVYAGVGMVQENYRLISQSPVIVTVSETGSPAPAVVIFTYAYQAPPTEIPTQAPTQEPTKEPTQAPTQAPTQEPTKEPTQAPTQEPTKEPTQAPTQQPAPESLIEAGTAMMLNDMPVTFTWYQDQNGNPMISLKALAAMAGWTYYPSGTSVLLGRTVEVFYNANGVSTLNVNGKPFANNALVWRGDLYVSADFLKALGVESAAADGQLTLTFTPQ